MESQRNVSIILHSIVCALSVSSIAELSPSDVATAFATHEAQRGAAIALFDSATVISPYLGMEISVGNASGLDVKQLGILIRHISLTIGSYSYFSIDFAFLLNLDWCTQVASVISSGI
jgi:hypothetical protein